VCNSIVLRQGGKTELHVAAFNGYNAIVLMLLKNGADPNAKDNVCRLLCLSIDEFTLYFFYLKDGMTPLHKAAWEGHADTVQHLLDKGADRNALDNVGPESPKCMEVLREKFCSRFCVEHLIYMFMFLSIYLSIYVLTI
jgi:hypothetical protein